MLQDKIKRYQRQHAHNLALEDMVDIVLKWDCSAESPQSHRMLPEKEIAYVQIAVWSTAAATAVTTDLFAASMLLQISGLEPRTCSRACLRKRDETCTW